MKVCNFELFPLDFEEIHEAAEGDTIDFALANSGMYVDFEATCGTNRIVTLKNLRLGNACSRIWRGFCQKQLIVFGVAVARDFEAP